MIIISDVCDTLYYSNTTMDYCRYVLREEKRNFSLVMLDLMISKKSPLFYSLAILSKILNHDIIKSRAIYFLKGISKPRLERLAELFVKNELSKKKVRKVFSIMDQYKGSRIILLSSSLDPVVSAIAAKLGAEFASTQLEYKQDICTGMINFEMKGKKHEVLENQFGELPGKLLVMSDNVTDEALMLKADIRYGVVHNGKHKLLWERLNAKIIEVNEK